MRKTIVMIVLIFLFLSCNQGQKKVITIGENNWFTEYGFYDALEKAKRENKPVLAYFTAKWCGPCQKMKKNLFEKKEFKRIAKRVVLLRIEQTEGLGRMLCKKFKIMVYPSVMLLDSNGSVIDRGWHGERGNTVKDVEEWLTISVEKTKPEFYKKPMPLNRLYNLVCKPFTSFSKFSDKERLKILENSLMAYAERLKGKTDSKAYYTILINFIGEVSSVYKTKKGEERKKDFLKKYDKKVSFLVSKMKEKKDRDYWIASYLFNTGRIDKAFGYIEKYTRNIKEIDYTTLRFLLLKMNFFLFYAVEHTGIEEKPSNLLKEYNTEKGLKIFNKVMTVALEKKDQKTRNLIFSHSLSTIEKLAKNKEKEIANKMAKKAFETLIRMDDLKKCEIFKKKIDWDHYEFNPQNFWLNVYLDDFTYYDLIPETIVDFCKKYYRDVNISYQIEYASYTIASYFTMGRYKEGMDFINQVLNDKDFMEKQSKVWWEYRLYVEIAYQLLKHNVNIDLAGKYAKKACKLRHYKESTSLFVLAMYRAKKGDYFDAVQLGKKAYNIELSREHSSQEILYKIKENLNKWENKLKK